MDDYISVNYAYNRLIKRASIDSQPRAIRRAAKILLELPLADVRENVHGEWILEYDDPYIVWRCPKCGWLRERTSKPKFCEECGADMREEGQI